MRVGRLWATGVSFAVLLVTALAGCSDRPGAGAAEAPAHSPDAQKDQADVSQPQGAPAITEELQDVPVAPQIAIPDLPPDAPSVVDRHPRLASGVLMKAKLGDLPGDALLMAPGVTLTRAELEAEFKQAPMGVRAQLRENSFFLLEQIATQRLLLAEARTLSGATGGDDAVLESHISALAERAVVSDEEVLRFYNENSQMMGGASHERMAPRIREHLLQGKRNELISEHIKTLADRLDVIVDSAWAAEQAVLASRNPVERARESGLPTLANFGAKGCGPCEAMEPIRNEIAKEYTGRANVVYVNVAEKQVLAARYGVQGIPHLVFYGTDGNEILQHTGFMSKEDIVRALTRAGLQ